MNKKGEFVSEIAKTKGRFGAFVFALRLLGLDKEFVNEDGGPGSGNWGHRGRPGKKGGSGKGGGSAMRSGSKETGYTSFTKSEEFGQISNLVKLHRSRGGYSPAEGKRNFWRDVTSKPELNQAMRAQHKAASPNESFSDYMDRMYDMLSSRVENEKTAPDIEKVLNSFKPGYKPLDKMTIEELKVSRVMQRYGSNPSRIVNNSFSTRDKAEFLEIVGNRTKWGEKLLDRNFKNLSETEEADLNKLLDSHPWSKDQNQAKIPNEKAILESEDQGVAEYYCALKAKAMGIGGVYVPDRPELLEGPEKKAV